MRLIELGLDESIDLGNGIMLKVIELPARETWHGRRGRFRSRMTGKLRLGVVAPRSISIARGELVARSTIPLEPKGGGDVRIGIRAARRRRSA